MNIDIHIHCHSLVFGTRWQTFYVLLLVVVANGSRIKYPRFALCCLSLLEIDDLVYFCLSWII